MTGTRRSAFIVRQLARLVVVLVVLATPSPVQAGDVLELEHDFGVVDEGSIVGKAFTVRNTTGRVMRIEKLRVSCTTCVRIVCSEKELEPGAETTFRIELNTTGKGGTVDQWAAVSTDSDEWPIIRMAVRCVVRACWAAPKRVALGMLRFDEPATQSFAIVAAGLPPLTVRDIRSSRPGLLSARLVDGTRRALGERVDQVASMSFTWSARRGAIDAGSVDETVTVVLVDADGETHDVEVDVSGFLTGDIRAQPSRLFFGRVRPGRIVSRLVRCEWREGALPRTGIELRTSHEALTATVEEHTATGFSVRAVIDPTRVTETGVFEGQITGVVGNEIVFAIPYTAARTAPRRSATDSGLVAEAGGDR